LAIEAVTQLNSDSDFPQEITGYTLRDLHISVAMVVPDNNDGVETLFSIRRGKTQGDKPEDGIANQWYSFTVASNSFGSWKEHARGTIGINKRRRGRAPDSSLNLPLQSSANTWFKHLHAIGFNYGPSFQNSTVIKSDGKTFAAGSDLMIKQKCGMVTGESRYAIHPVCMDSCLQLHLLAKCAGMLSDVTSGIVPTYFTEVSVFPPSAGQLDNQQASAHALVTKHGARAIVTNSQIVAPDGELIVDFSNVRNVIYDLAKLSQPQEQYMQMGWKPDVEYFGASQSQLSMLELVELSLYKNPSTRILALDEKLATLVQEVNPAANMEVIGNQDGQEGLNYVSPNLEANSNEFEGGNNAYDLVLAQEVRYPLLLLRCQS
jgi:hypothetical protein